MSLLDKISEDIKTAMLAREKDKLEALRAIKSALLLARTEKGVNTEVTEDTELKIVQKLLKQRKESADIYKAQNRQDLYENEIKEAAVIEKYLPAMMSDEELTAAIKAIIAQVGAKSPADMGKVMGASKQLAGKAEGKAIADKVKTLLAG
jgi:uncharacterized protein